MAIIGTFTPTRDGGFTGSIKTLTLNHDVTIRPLSKSDSDSDKAPDFRLVCGDYEFGAGWKKLSRDQNPYISVKFDDPTFPAPAYATLVEMGEDGEHALIWSR